MTGIQQHLNSVSLPDDEKIVLIINNCLTDTSLKSLVKDSGSILFFLTNRTSIIQPMDIGIMHALKCKYKAAF
ncbi:hypothetical protein X975_15643, partial [Stegodyphus mimosarum]